MSKRRGRDMRQRGNGAFRQRRGLSKGWTWALVAAVLLLFIAYLAEPLWSERASDPASSEEQLALGRQVFTVNCVPCHGANGEGQAPDQPNGGQRADGTYIAPALNGTAHSWHHAPDQLFEIVRNGSPAADSPMKGFAGRLSDAEIHAVLSYVRSLWPPGLRERYHGMHGMGGMGGMGAPR